MDKLMYADFVILHRMRVSHVYKLWERAGDFLVERGFPIHGFMMYTGVALMRMQTRPLDKDNGITLQKASELAKTINSSDNKQMAVYAFKEIWKNWKLGSYTKLSLFLQALLNKALATYFIRHALCFNSAMDFEIKYLNQIFELGFFNNNIEWLVCNILHLALNAMDVSHGARRLKQAKHLLHAARVIMIRCNRSDLRYQSLYECYQLCKCVYWGVKIDTNMNEISNRFVCFNLTSMGIQITDSSEIDVSLIKSEEDIIETFKKIQELSDTLKQATNKDIANIYSEILLCQKKYDFLQTLNCT